MTNACCKLYLRLMKYAAFMGILGGIATFIGPPHSGLIKAGIGIVIGAALLGKQFPDALTELKRINDDLIENIFRE